VRHAFDLVLLNLNWNTDEVMLTRDEMAQKMLCTSTEVSRVMGTLRRMGVIKQERRKVEGMRGRGMAVYYINPHVACNGSLEIRRQAAQETIPPSRQTC
jgi:predicted transcriptional regulator